jgi:hypothetical protein
MKTPETIALSRYEGDHEMHMAVWTGKTHKDANWLTEVFILGCRTTRGAWVLDPSPQWVHIDRIKAYGGANETNIRGGHYTELRHICDVLNAREKSGAVCEQ